MTKFIEHFKFSKTRQTTLVTYNVTTNDIVENRMGETIPN